MRFVLLTLAALAAAAAVAPARADSPPVGPLPAGPTTSISTTRGQLVAVALPRQGASTGLVWRVARTVNSRVLRQVSEADVDSSVVVVFRAVGAGTANVVFALTRGETSKAHRAVRYRVRVR